MAYIYIPPKEKVYAKVYKVFNGNASNSFAINIGQNYPNIEKELLTTEDFVCSYKQDNDQPGRLMGNGGRSDSYYSTAEALTVTPSYDPQSGILTISFNGTCTAWKNPETAGAWGWSGLKLEVYMIVNGIREQYT